MVVGLDEGGALDDRAGDPDRRAAAGGDSLEAADLVVVFLDGSGALALFLFFISPWFVDPLFNKFVPLQPKHPELVESIERLTQRAGVPISPERMFLMEASAKTNELNAYVTGIGASKRVVIWDTTIAKTKPDELLVIVGHELGHYVLGHVVKGSSFFCGLLCGIVS